MYENVSESICYNEFKQALYLRFTVARGLLSRRKLLGNSVLKMAKKFSDSSASFKTFIYIS